MIAVRSLRASLSLQLELLQVVGLLLRVVCLLLRMVGMLLVRVKARGLLVVVLLLVQELCVCHGLHLLCALTLKLDRLGAELRSMAPGVAALALHLETVALEDLIRPPTEHE